MWRNEVVRFCYNISIFNYNNCRLFISLDKSKMFEIDIKKNLRGIKLFFKRICFEFDIICFVIYRILFIFFIYVDCVVGYDLLLLLDFFLYML